MGDQALQFLAFCRCQFAVFADGEVAEVDVHDADTIQFGDLVVQKLTHPADLAVQALVEDNAKGVWPLCFDQTFFCDCIQDGNAVAHAVDEFRGDGRLDSRDVLLVVIVSSAQDLVDDIPIIGKENEALGGFVQAADWEEALLVLDIRDDVLRFFGISRTDDAHWFIEGDIERLGFGFEGFAVDPDDITG